MMMFVAYSVAAFLSLCAQADVTPINTPEAPAVVPQETSATKPASAQPSAKPETQPAEKKDHPQAEVLKVAPSVMSHRARYEISLERPSAEPSVDGGLSQLTGHAIIELRPVPGGCIRNVTFVMYAYSNDLPMQTIIRSFATFESEDGQNFTFRVNTRNELGEEVSIKGEGLSPPQLKGVVQTDIDTSGEDNKCEEDSETDDLNTLEPTNVRIDIPVGTVFPSQFLKRMMRMISGSVCQESSTLTLYDPYWSSVHDVDMAVIPSNVATQFNWIDVVSDQAKKQLQGQPVKSVICGFYPVGLKENKSDGADEPMHQMKISLLPCGIITELVMEDPAVGEPIKLVLSRVDVLG